MAPLRPTNPQGRTPMVSGEWTTVREVWILVLKNDGQAFEGSLKSLRAGKKWTFFEPEDHHLKEDGFFSWKNLNHQCSDLQGVVLPPPDPPVFLRKKKPHQQHRHYLGYLQTMIPAGLPRHAITYITLCAFCFAGKPIGFSYNFPEMSPPWEVGIPGYLIVSKLCDNRFPTHWFLIKQLQNGAPGWNPPRAGKTKNRRRHQWILEDHPSLGSSQQPWLVFVA